MVSWRGRGQLRHQERVNMSPDEAMTGAAGQGFPELQSQQLEALSLQNEDAGGCGTL